MPKQKKNICLVCLHVFTSIKSQTVNALRMTAFVCVCLCVWYACLWVGYVTGRQSKMSQVMRVPCQRTLNLAGTLYT